MMNVLYVINDFNKGGAEKMLSDVLPFIKQEGVILRVLQLSNKYSELSYIENLESEGIKVDTLSSTKLLNPIIFLKLLIYLFRNKFDVIHVHLFPALYYISLAKKILRFKTPLVFTEHSVSNKRMENKRFQKYDRFIYKEYHKIIAISNEIKQKLHKWLGHKALVSIIQNGYNFDRLLNAKSYDPNYLNTEFNIPQGAIKVLMTARFTAPKDHTTVLKAAKLLPDHIHFLFAGSNGDVNKIKKLAISLEIAHRIHFLGFRKDIPRLMKTVDLNLLSSDYEGMSGVAIESLMSGKPFLGSDVHGINDVIPDIRFLFKKRDHIMLSEMIKFIFDPEKKLEINNLVKMGLKSVNKFSLERYVENHLKVYDDIANKQKYG